MEGWASGQREKGEPAGTQSCSQKKISSLVVKFRKKSLKGVREEATDTAGDPMPRLESKLQES